MEGESITLHVHGSRVRLERLRGGLKAKTGRVSKSDEGGAYLLWKVHQLSLSKK